MEKKLTIRSGHGYGYSSGAVTCAAVEQLFVVSDSPVTGSTHAL